MMKPLFSNSANPKSKYFGVDARWMIYTFSALGKTYYTWGFAPALTAQDAEKQLQTQAKIYESKAAYRVNIKWKRGQPNEERLAQPNL